MPKTLSEDPEEIVRQLIVDEWGNPNVPTGGFDTQQTDPTAADFLPVSKKWAGFGDVFPAISVTNNDPTVRAGGETGVTGIQGDGSGSNQHRFETMTLTVMAEDLEGGDYNGEDADEVIKTLYDHVFEILWENQNAPNHPEVRAFYVTPGTHTSEGDDTSLTEQMSGEVTLDWLKTP